MPITTPTSARSLASFAAALRFDDIPQDVREHAKLAMLDTVGCGLFGSTLPWTGILLRTLASVDDSPRSAVWGTDRRLSVVHAALVNGTAVHGFELDDLHPRSILHPGSVVLPAAMAAADVAVGLGAEVSGERLVTAVVAAYEVASRIGQSVGAAHLLQGWHPTGTHGVFAAAIAAGVMLGLDAGTLDNALGIAGSQAGGLMASQYGSMVKRFHAGRAAQSGLYSALLARNGFTGIEDVLEAPYGGYCTTVSPRYSPEALTAGLGEVWETRNVGFKPYSTNGSCHPSIDAILELRRTERFSVDQIDRVVAQVSTATYQHVGWAYQPTSVTAAQMNLSYIAAAVLTDGAAFVDQFSEDRIHDPALIELADRVHVEADADIDAAGDARRHATRLQIVLDDGRVLHAEREHAHGSARDPMETSEVVAKFRDLAGRVLSEDGVSHLHEVVQRIESHGVEDLTEALTAIGR